MTDKDKPTITLEKDITENAHWRAADGAIYSSADEALHHAVQMLALDMTDENILTHCGEAVPVGRLMLFTSYHCRGYPQADPIFFHLWPGRAPLVCACMSVMADARSHEAKDFETTTWKTFQTWILTAGEL